MNKLRIAGTILSRQQMKLLSGGSAPAAMQYRCTNGGPGGYVLVCVGGGASPTATCGYSLCDYVSTCSPAEVSCGTGVS